jgi:hypothetical protein
MDVGRPICLIASSRIVLLRDRYTLCLESHFHICTSCIHWILFFVELHSWFNTWGFCVYYIVALHSQCWINNTWGFCVYYNWFKHSWCMLLRATAAVRERDSGGGGGGTRERRRRWGNERAAVRARESDWARVSLVGNITRRFLKNVQGPCKSGRREYH